MFLAVGQTFRDTFINMKVIVQGMPPMSQKHCLEAVECSRFVPHLVVVDFVLIVVVVVVIVVVVVGVVVIVVVVVAVVIGVDVIVVVVVVTSIGQYHRLPAMMNYSCDVIVLSHSATHQHRLSSDNPRASAA